MELLELSCVRPRQARYQAALRPDMKGTTHSKALSDFLPAPIHGFCLDHAHADTPSGVTAELSAKRKDRKAQSRQQEGSSPR